MSSPRDPDGSGWREPEHLGGGGGSGGPCPGADPGQGAGEEPPARGRPWRRPARRDLPGDDAGRPVREEPGPPVVDAADPFGVQAWAVQHGWTVSDGDGPRDAVLADLVRSAPVRPGKDARPAGVLRGRYGALELVAFDIAYPLGRGLVPRWAVTAAPLLASVPQLRLAPTRFWKHRTGGLLQLPSGDEEFDLRWVLLAPEDDPRARRLVQDPTVRGLLLGSDDGDEFWTAAGHLAAIRPEGQRPLLVEHHARLLTAALGALSAG
jgi:hypothetical protein